MAETAETVAVPVADLGSSASGTLNPSSSFVVFPFTSLCKCKYIYVYVHIDEVANLQILTMFKSVFLSNYFFIIIYHGFGDIHA